MKVYCTTIFFTFCLFFMCSQPALGQEKWTISYDTAYCYQSYINEHTNVVPRLSQKQISSGRLESSNFIVHYDGFTPEAKAAFEYAISIWDNLIDTPVPIRVNARWISLGPGVLGSAIWGKMEDGFSGSMDETSYPIALAEKIAGVELNESTDPDIIANFSLDASWYFGLDGATPSGQTDLVSVVLHEIGHGLGISDSFADDAGAQRGFFGITTGIPNIYDRFVSNGNSEILVETYENNSLILHIQLISEALFFDSPIAKSENGGITPRIYAPNPFNGGSSIAHLDESTYPAGDDNSLMTPQIGFAEAIHDPGSIILNMMADMGWIHTYIDHSIVQSTEDLNSDVLVEASITSDTDLNTSEIFLQYSTDGFNSVDLTVSMTSTGGDVFSASVPASGSEQLISYYLIATDKYGRTYREPETGFYEFQFAIDTTPPTIEITPPQFVFAFDTELTFTATVTDSYGVGPVQLSYQLNEEPTLQETMTLEFGSANQYTHTIDLTGLSLIDGDKIHFSIEAVDASMAGNMASYPASGSSFVPVRDYGVAVPSYANTFNSPSDDFVGNHFRIESPEGFNNAGIHSDHPYEDGTGPNNESSFTYTLLKPITLKFEDANIDFDEIVLVEPGEPGAVFSQEFFYDYVIVEGSTDGGETWEQFLKGYDSGSQSEWLDHYNSEINTPNSDAIGEPGLYTHRSIDMLANGKFSAGEEVIIRFRLFADANSHGWGWAIDNLAIQDEIVGIAPGLSSDISFFPNPASTQITIDNELPFSVGQLVLINALGKEVIRKSISQPTARLVLPIDHLESGHYILIIQTLNSTYRSKVVVNK